MSVVRDVVRGAEREGRSLTYQPALDGVRAVAVTLVLLFHQGFAWMSGGYVGVSVFFTLSGFLITTLLVTEHRRRGRVALGRFYSRRARRLLPAGFLCLALIATARLLGAFDGVVHLRRDLLGSLFQVQNWVKLAGTASYTELLNASVGERSPLEHFWSLAIEEQFYWLWPLVLTALFAIVRGFRARRVAVTGLAVAAGVVAPLIAELWGADAAYWATPARIAEILIGAALAMWMIGESPAGSRIVRRPAAVCLTTVGLVVVLSAAVTWPADGGPAYRGLLPVFALGSAALIAGLQGPSALRGALALAPVAALGRISYGVYLYHWPVFVLLDEDRTGLDGPVLFALRTAVTLAIATVSYVLVERPIRQARGGVAGRVRVQALVAVAAAAAVAGLAVVVPAGARDFYEPDATRAEAVKLQPVASLAPLRPAPTPALAPASTTSPASTATTATTIPMTAVPMTAVPMATIPMATIPMTTVPATTVPATTTTVGPSRPVRVLVVGDSTALATGTGLIDWAAAHPTVAQVSLATSPGCGFIRETVIVEDFPFQEECDALLDAELPDAIATLRPDVVVLMVTMRDLEDRTWSSAEGLLTPFDPRYAARLLDAQRSIVDRVTAAGVAEVVWILPPRPVSPFLADRRHMSDPERYAVQEETIRAVAAERWAEITLADLAAWMEARDMILDVERRPDGLHFTPEASLEIADEFLVPRILAAALG